jgi:hypothetical protein
MVAIIFSILILAEAVSPAGVRALCGVLIFWEALLIVVRLLVRK